MVDEQWDSAEDIEIGDDVFIVTHLQSVNIYESYDTVSIGHENIVLLRDELSKIISRLELD